MENYMPAFLVLLAFLLLSRLVNTKAIKKLEPEKKAALVEIFSQNRSWVLGILIAFFAFYFVSITYELLDIYWTNIIYILLGLIYMAAMAVYVFRKLKEFDFPKTYISSYILSTFLRFLGLGLFLVLLGV